MGAILSCLTMNLPSWLVARSSTAKKADDLEQQTEEDTPSPSSKPAAATPPAPPAPIHIAIIGCGIGGLSLAVGCLRHGVSFTLYEAAAQYSVVGAGVGLGPNALRAMALLDPRLRALYDGIASGNLTAAKRHVAMEALYAEPGFGAARGWTPQPFGAPCYERTSAHRRDLLNILTSLIPADAVQFGRRVAGIEQDVAAGHVTLTFSDGTTATATAAIGCDGVRGASRGVVLGEAGFAGEVAPVFSGKYAYRSVVPMARAQAVLGAAYAGDAKCFNGPGVQIMTYPISAGTECNVVACRFVEGAWTRPQWTHSVAPAVVQEDFASVDARLVELIQSPAPVQWALHHHPDTSTYCHGLVCLLGDAAHATTPHQASGAGMSIEDALVLAHVLGRVARWQDLPAAFAAYDAVRRPRAQRVVQTSQELGRIYACADPRFGDDMAKIVANLNERFLWIWEHDTEGDLEKVEAEFAARTA